MPSEPTPTTLTVQVDDPDHLIASVDVMAECPGAVVLHVELTSKTIEPNCAAGDSIEFYRMDADGVTATAHLQVASLLFDGGEFGPAWAYTAGGYDLVTVTITPRRHGRTVYKAEVQHEQQ